MKLRFVAMSGGCFSLEAATNRRLGLSPSLRLVRTRALPACHREEVRSVQG